MTVKVNSPEGLSFALGMMDHAAKMRKHKAMFEDWIKYKGWDSWHLHDGWVCKNYRSGKDVTKSDRINLTWITEHAESHSPNMPSKRQTILIVNGFPGDPVLKATLYGVTGIDGHWSRMNRLDLSKLDAFTIKFKDGKFTITE